MRARLDNLRASSPLLYRLIEKNPDYFDWLERPENLEQNYTYLALNTNWLEDFFPGRADSPERMQNSLKRFRQKMALRIAYREVNQLSSIRQSFIELSLLAIFCVQVSADCLYPIWKKRLGTPTHPDTQKETRYCIFGLGKLGGDELNFWSDIDLIYLYENQGHCLKRGKETAISNQEFFNRFFRDLTSFLNDRSEHGILYNLDLRLRPEGNAGPIVRTFDAMESYYCEAGQTWERMAYIRARPIAGDLSLGAEFLEELTPYVYPRHTQKSFFKEVAGLKLRTEREVIGSNSLHLDIKTGHGGIREIEYQVQAMQSTQGSRYPFLQTPSILEALEQLERYGLFPPEKCHFLREAYLTLRKIENRLQMREETQTHALPPPGPERTHLATILGYESESTFTQSIDALREKVRAHYLDLFEATEEETEIQEWSLYFSGKPPSDNLREQLQRWFGDSEDIAEKLAYFALGNTRHLITREHILLFLEVARHFDTLLPGLATPLQTLERVAQFAESYGARKQFFKMTTDQACFKILCLLFDRSRFIHKLLRKHPEIMEELLYESPARQKSFEVIQSEIAKLPQDSAFQRLLWLYVKAEQVRLAIGELTGRLTIEEVRSSLSTLADAVVDWTLKKIAPESKLTLIGLGKYGARELGFGSDLDLLVIGEQSSLEKDLKIVQKLNKLLRYPGGLGSTLELDFRLRPFGHDGPLITTLHAFKTYHLDGHAQQWERQLLTRQRVIAGDPEKAQQFKTFVDTLLYQKPIHKNDIRNIWHMRLKAEKEATSECVDSHRAIKTGAGGSMDIEFLAQIIQLQHGWQHPSLRNACTTEVLRQAADMDIISQETADVTHHNYTFLRKIEFCLRRFEFSPISTIPKRREREKALANWMHFSSFKELFEQQTECMRTNRDHVSSYLEKEAIPLP